MTSTITSTMASTHRRLRRSLLAATIVGAGCLAAVLAVPIGQGDGNAAQATGLSAPGFAANGFVEAPGVAPTVAPISDLTVPRYVETRKPLTVEFVCPADLAVDGKVTTSVKADQIDRSSSVLASFDIPSDGTVAFKDSNEGVVVTWTWELPSVVAPATGLVVRAACDGAVDVDDKTTFKEATLEVVNPINKFVTAQYPAEKKAGEKVEFQVVCDRSAANGSFVMADKNGTAVIETADSLGGGETGIVSRTPTATGFEIIVEIPRKLASGDYTVKFGCTSLVGDVVIPYSGEIEGEDNFSAELPIKVVGKVIPPTE